MILPLTLVNDLRPLLSPDALVTDAAELPAYGQDFWTQRGMPGVVVRAARAEDVVATLRYAAARGIAVVPRAAGTNVSAGFLPTPERILLDLRPMNRVLSIDTERREAVVQPGVINGDLNRRGSRRSASASRPIPAPRSSPPSAATSPRTRAGMHCLKYGVTVHHVNAIGLRPDRRRHRPPRGGRRGAGPARPPDRLGGDARRSSPRRRSRSARCPP